MTMNELIAECKKCLVLLIKLRTKGRSPQLVREAIEETKKTITFLKAGRKEVRDPFEEENKIIENVF